MNEFTINELKELILYRFEPHKKRKYTKKPKQPIKKKIETFIQPNYKKKYEEQPENLNDFHLNFGLNYIEPKKKLQPKKQEEENDWFDIGSGKSNVQSVLIPKKYFTREKAIKYVTEHFQFKKIDDNQRKNYYSFRQFDPHPHAHYISKKLKNHIILIIESN
jgi:hypothetical protein